MMSSSTLLSNKSACRDAAMLQLQLSIWGQSCTSKLHKPQPIIPNNNSNNQQQQNGNNNQHQHMMNGGGAGVAAKIPIHMPLYQPLPALIQPNVPLINMNNHINM